MVQHQNQHLGNIANKKGLFFKKKQTNKILVSKRVSLLLRKRKRFSSKVVKRDTGNFFFKKFFYKTLLRSRTWLGSFFSFKSHFRQNRLTNRIDKYKVGGHSTTLHEMLLRGGLFFFSSDAIIAIKNGLVYKNGASLYNKDNLIVGGDVIQVAISKSFYDYLLFCKKFFKKKIKLFRYNA